MLNLSIGLMLSAGNGGVAAPDAPVITQTTAAGNNPMQWDATYTNLIIGTDYIRCRWRIDAGAWTYETDVLFDSAFYLDYGVDGVAYPWPLFTAEVFTTGQVVDVQEGILRGGITTWSNTLTDTMAASGLPIPSTGLGIYQNAADLSTMWQLVAGATAVAADGDVVGRWDDQSINARHLAAAADNTTRPTYHTAGGIHYVEFDGSNDMLRYLADLGLWNASGFTLAIAMRSVSNATAAALVSSGNTGSNNQFYNAVYARSTATFEEDAGVYIRNNSGVDVLSSTVNTYTNAFDGTDRVIIIEDDGSGVTIYKDNVAGSRRAYTRSGNTLTLNNFVLGGLLRTTAGNHFPARVHALAVWPSTILSSGDRAAVNTYFGSLQGRSI